MNKSQPSKFLAAQALHQILPKLGRMMRKVEQQSGATGQQLSAIAAISEFGKDRIHTLATHEGVSRPTMSRLVTTLEGRGWVEKCPDEQDRRTPKLSVTVAGRDILVQSCAERTHVFMDIMGALDDEECSALSACLRKLSMAPVQSDLLYFMETRNC